MNESLHNFENSEEVVETKPSSSKEKKIRAKKSSVSNEMRKLVIRALESGMCSRKSAASTFNLTYTTVASIYNKFLKTGELEKKTKEKKQVIKKTKKIKNDNKKLNRVVDITDDKTLLKKKIVKKKHESKVEKLNPEHLKFLVDLLAENCKYTLGDLRTIIQNKFSIDIKTHTITSKLPPFHYNLKRAEDVALTTVTPEIINDHKEYCELFLQLNESGRPLIYFDETEFHITMKRYPAGNPRMRQTQNVPPPSLRIRNKTILASMSHDELLYYKALDGPNDRMRLLEYLNGLFDLLSDRNITGAVVIMGNAAFNYCNAITEATQLAGHEVVFLPACSAFLNPVENLFSQWSLLIRAKNPTSEKELENLIASFNGVLSSHLCQYYCMHVIENATSCVTGKLIYAK